MAMLERALAWSQQHPVAYAAGSVVLLLLGAWIAWVVSRRVILHVITSVIRRSTFTWDDAFLERGVFSRLTAAIPAVLLYQGANAIPEIPDRLSSALQRIALAWVCLLVAHAVSAALTAANDVYTRFPTAKDRPIKGILQVVAIVAYIGAGILAGAALFNRSPLLVLSGLGAMTAVTMLVFRDSLLSLVAGIQITTNNLIRVGDWIEMPQFHADGDVIDIALNTIQVSNWDKTITVIPAHKFLEHSFKNWRGMQESGGRRIKRSVHIDVSTIRFLTDEEIEHFGRFHLLKDYIAEKKAELEEHNRQLADHPDVIANVRRLTNVGTLRAYLMAYLRQNTRIHKEMTFLVRQLQPTSEGLPLEIYVFVNDVRWAVYEGVQADVFDHVFAIAPEFGLRIFQSPSGNDFARALSGRPQVEGAPFAEVHPVEPDHAPRLRDGGAQPGAPKPEAPDHDRA